MERPKTIACDFDGVIRNQKTNEPIPNALESINRLIKDGYEVVILTANDTKLVDQWMLENWSESEDCPEATNTKPPAVAYIDDRGIRFTHWEDILKHFL